MIDFRLLSLFPFGLLVLRLKLAFDAFEGFFDAFEGFSDASEGCFDAFLDFRLEVTHDGQYKVKMWLIAITAK